MDRTQEFINNGYTLYENCNNKNVSKLFEKRIFDEDKNIKYFIHIKEYSFKDKLYETMPKEAKENYRYEYEIQLGSKENGTMNITMFSSGWDVKKAEKHIETIFNTGLFLKYDDVN